MKVAITTGGQTRVSHASAIDLAGSEDNRRTDNDKERMVESASINKSLFVLAQCVEAITKKHHRIPYRESKMTRILSLGQNNGLTVMILNLAPVRSYHLDTISSLNFANRTKKIELREVENEPIFKGPPRPAPRPSVASQRQPLRPLTASVNVNLAANKDKESSKPSDGKPIKAFSVYSDKPRPRTSAQFKKPEIPTRPSLSSEQPGSRSAKASRLAQPPKAPPQHQGDISSRIEELVEKKVEEILAVRAVSEKSRQTQVRELNDQVQRRLELLEQRIEGSEDARAEGLSYLLMAKQHQGRGEDASALKMYQLALPFFPENEKLVKKIDNIKMRMVPKSRQSVETTSTPATESKKGLGSILSLPSSKQGTKRPAEDVDADYEDHESCVADSDDDFEETKRRKRTKAQKISPELDSLPGDGKDDESVPSPRTIHLLSIINSRDVSQIKLLKGVGAKKAEAIVDCLCELDQSLESNEESQVRINSLAELSKLKGCGVKTVQSMRTGVLV